VTDAGPNNLLSTSQNVNFTSSGQIAGAISFNVNTSYFQIYDLTGLGVSNQPFSISLWIRPYALAGTVVFVGNVANTWCVRFIGFASNCSVVAQMCTGTARSIFGPTLSTLSIWYHVVQTWSSTNGLRLYVDYVLVAADTTVVSYSASSMSDNVKLANRPNNGCTGGAIGPQLAFYGDIDDFRIYSRELTPNDVCALYFY
jgi:hypothetical protein